MIYLVVTSQYKGGRNEVDRIRVSIVATRELRKRALRQREKDEEHAKVYS